MVLGIGIDGVNISRFEKAAVEHGARFLNKIFTDKELDYAKSKKAYYIHIAGKFAAKEAVKKALPDGAKIGLTWTDIEILNDSDGKPYASLHGAAKEIGESCGIGKVFVSISHTEDMAVANAMAVKNGTGTY